MTDQGKITLTDVADVNVIEQICQNLVDDGDYQTLVHLIRVNQHISKVCQKMLGEIKKTQQEIIIYYRFGLGDDEYVVFPFKVYGKEYTKLVTEIDTYNQWIADHDWGKLGFEFKLYKSGDLPIHEEDLGNVKDLRDAVESHDNIDDLWTGKEEYTGGIIGIGFDKVLPVTKKLIERGTTKVEFNYEDVD